VLPVAREVRSGTAAVVSAVITSTGTSSSRSVVLYGLVNLVIFLTVDKSTALRVVIGMSGYNSAARFTAAHRGRCLIVSRIAARVP